MLCWCLQLQRSFSNPWPPIPTPCCPRCRARTAADGLGTEPAENPPFFFFFNSTPQGGIRSWCNRLGGSCQREPLRKCWGLRGWRKTPVLEEKYSDSCMKSGIDEASVHMFKSWLLWFHQSLPFPPVLVGIQRALNHDLPAGKRKYPTGRMLQHIHSLLWCRVRDAKQDPGTQEPLSHLHSRVGQEEGGRALLEGGEITGMSCPTHAGCLLGCFQLSMLLLLFYAE